VFFFSWEVFHNVYFSFGESFAFWEEYFHKIKGRETLSRSHNDLNTTDDNVGLSKLLASTELYNAWVGI
jgi:hypothetical protein